MKIFFRCYRFSIPLLLFFPLIFVFQQSNVALAQSESISAYDLISAVNNLRASHSLPALDIHPILMSVAQGQSDYQASIQSGSHAGPDGSTPKSRAQAAGYGSGFSIIVSENVASLDIGVENQLEIIINEIWADSVHTGTMVNPKYAHVGAGLARGGDMNYFTLLVGGMTGQKNDSPVAAQTTPLLNQTPIVTTPKIAFGALVKASPNADGSLTHVVGYGQTLEKIANLYGVKINDLVQLNKIDPNTIYEGQKLIIFPPGTIPTSTSTPTEIPPTITPKPAVATQVISLSPTAITTDGNPSVEEDTFESISELPIIIVFCLLAGVVLLMVIGLKKPGNS